MLKCVYEMSYATCSVKDTKERKRVILKEFHCRLQKTLYEKVNVGWNEEFEPVKREFMG